VDLWGSCAEKIREFAVSLHDPELDRFIHESDEDHSDFGILKYSTECPIAPDPIETAVASIILRPSSHMIEGFYASPYFELR